MPCFSIIRLIKLAWYWRPVMKVHVILYWITIAETEIQDSLMPSSPCSLAFNGFWDDAFLECIASFFPSANWQAFSVYLFWLIKFLQYWRKQQNDRKHTMSCMPCRRPYYCYASTVFVKCEVSRFLKIFFTEKNLGERPKFFGRGAYWRTYVHTFNFF